MMIHRIALYVHGNASNITPQDALRFAAKIYERLDFSPIFEQVDEIIREIAPGLGCNDSPPWATSHNVNFCIKGEEDE